MSNLEWCTAKYNCNYGSHNEKLSKNHKLNKKTLQFDLDGNLINTWRSASLASKTTGVSKCNIIACCNKKEHYNTAGGYVWRYADDKS